MKKFSRLLMVCLLCMVILPVSAFAADSERPPEVYIDTANPDEYVEATAPPEKDYDSLFDGNRNRDNERAIQSVDSGAVVNPATVGSPLDAYDILTRVALVFTVISVIVLWIRNTIRERKDPIKKYLK